MIQVNMQQVIFGMENLGVHQQVTFIAFSKKDEGVFKVIDKSSLQSLRALEKLCQYMEENRFAYIVDQKMHAHGGQCEALKARKIEALVEKRSKATAATEAAEATAEAKPLLVVNTDQVEAIADEDYSELKQIASQQLAQVRKAQEAQQNTSSSATTVFLRLFVKGGVDVHLVEIAYHRQLAADIQSLLKKWAEQDRQIDAAKRKADEEHAIKQHERKAEIVKAGIQDANLEWATLQCAIVQYAVFLGAIHQVQKSDSIDLHHERRWSSVELPKLPISA